MSYYQLSTCGNRQHFHPPSQPHRFSISAETNSSDHIVEACVLSSPGTIDLISCSYIPASNCMRHEHDT